MYQYPCPSNRKYIEAASVDGISWTEAANSDTAEIQQIKVELQHERCLNQLGIHLNDLVIAFLAELQAADGAAGPGDDRIAHLPNQLDQGNFAVVVFEILVQVLSQVLSGESVAVLQPGVNGKQGMTFAVTHLTETAIAPAQRQTHWQLPSGEIFQLEVGTALSLDRLQQLQAGVVTGVWQMCDDQTVIGWLLLYPYLTATTSRITHLVNNLVKRSIQQCITTLRQLRLIQTQYQKQQKLQACNQDLAQANQLKSEFLANTSHEIRTPLSSILGFTHLLQAQGFNPTNLRQQEYLNIILTSGQHLLALINDILDLSKIEANQLDLQWETVDVPRVCQMAVTLVREKANDKGLKLNLSVSPQVTTLVADPLRLKQMLFNLLSNAIKFTLKGSVGLDVTAADDRFRFTVWDTGTGIAQDQQKLLFRPYSQIANTAADREHGTGLGLALTQKLAELHGGWVEVTSEINQGSQFTISLPKVRPTRPEPKLCPEPVVSSPAEQAPPPQDQPAMAEPTRSQPPGVDSALPPPPTTPATGALRTRRKAPVSPSDKAVAVTPPLQLPVPAPRPHQLLLVEDNIHNAKLMLAFLSKLGYEISWVQSGREMWQSLERSLPSLILMDVHLPGEDGLTLTRQLKRDDRYQAIPVIAQTAMAMKGDRDLCLAAGAVDYISKPIDLNDLKTTVARYVTSSHCRTG